MSRRERTDEEMLRHIRDQLRERIVVCEDECRREGGSDIGQAISEETLWLQALLVQTENHISS